MMETSIEKKVKQWKETTYNRVKLAAGDSQEVLSLLLESYFSLAHWKI